MMKRELTEREKQTIARGLRDGALHKQRMAEGCGFDSALRAERMADVDEYRRLAAIMDEA